MTMPRKGDFITASGGPVEDPRRARIFKGKFLTSDATGHPVKFNKAIGSVLRRTGRCRHRRDCPAVEFRQAAAERLQDMPKMRGSELETAVDAIGATA